MMIPRLEGAACQPTNDVKSFSEDTHLVYAVRNCVIAHLNRSDRPSGMCWTGGGEVHFCVWICPFYLLLIPMGMEGNGTSPGFFFFFSVLDQSMVCLRLPPCIGSGALVLWAMLLFLFFFFFFLFLSCFFLKRH